MDVKTFSRFLAVAFVAMVETLSCVEAEEANRSPHQNGEIAELGLQLSESFESPVLIQRFHTPGDGHVALVGDSTEVTDRVTYFGALWILHFDSSDRLIGRHLADSSHGTYRAYSGSRYFAVSSSLPESILHQITIVDSLEPSLRTYETNVPTVSDFTVFDGFLYFSTERTRANIRRIDLETGEQYRYEGFYEHGTGLFEQGGLLYAYSEEAVYEVGAQTIRRVDRERLTARRSTEWFSMSTADAAFFDSWNELLAALPHS